MRKSMRKKVVWLSCLVAGLAGCNGNGPTPSPGASTVEKVSIDTFCKAPFYYTHVDYTDFRYTPPAVLTSASGTDCSKISLIGEELRGELRDEQGHVIRLPIDLQISWYSATPCWDTNGLIDGQRTCGETGALVVTTSPTGTFSVPIALKAGPNSFFPSYHSLCGGAIPQSTPDCGTTRVIFCVSVAHTKKTVVLATAEWYTSKPGGNCVTWISELKLGGACPQARVVAAQSQSAPWDEFPTALDCRCDRFNWADADGDGDVDQSDFGEFQLCLGLPATGPCQCYAREEKLITLEEYFQFLPCLSGPNIRSPGCE